ncbi:MAG TPA: hypothetical protein VFR23_03035 [Jiangellaceae bacterium]|nr:hypothetical protein [Jiangellaceae bacterium]
MNVANQGSQSQHGARRTVLSIGVSSQTNVRVLLREPVTVKLPKAQQTIVELRCYADDPRGFVDAARAFLA